MTPTGEDSAGARAVGRVLEGTGAGRVAGRRILPARQRQAWPLTWFGRVSPLRHDEHGEREQHARGDADGKALRCKKREIPPYARIEGTGGGVVSPLHGVPFRDNCVPDVARMLAIERFRNGTRCREKRRIGEESWQKNGRGPGCPGGVPRAPQVRYSRTSSSNSPQSPP